MNPNTIWFLVGYNNAEKKISHNKRIYLANGLICKPYKFLTGEASHLAQKMFDDFKQTNKIIETYVFEGTDLWTTEAEPEKLTDKMNERAPDETHSRVRMTKLVKGEIYACEFNKDRFNDLKSIPGIKPYSET